MGKRKKVTQLPRRKCQRILTEKEYSPQWLVQLKTWCKRHMFFVDFFILVVCGYCRHPLSVILFSERRLHPKSREKLIHAVSPLGELSLTDTAKCLHGFRELRDLKKNLLLFPSLHCFYNLIQISQLIY